MSLPYELFIALRYLRAKRRKKVISLNTLVSIGGVCIGVAALIATLAVMTGFTEDLRDKILGTTSHIVVSDRTSNTLEHYDALVEDILKVPHVVAATPFIFKQVLLSSPSSAFGVVLRGIDPEKEGTVTKLGENMVEGTLKFLSTPPPNLPLQIDPMQMDPKQKTEENKPEKTLPGIVMGMELANRLGVYWGDVIHVISPMLKQGASIGQALGGPGGFTPKIRKFSIVGLFDSGMYEYDSSLAYISLVEAQKFFNFEDVATGIEVKVDDIFLADEVAKDIETALDFPYQARDWKALNRNLFSALELEKDMMFVILILIILVASFNIVGTLTMTVAEKAREIAILKAMGATKQSITRIFMFEGLIIGGIGVAVGLPLGLAVSFALETFYKLPGDVYYISSLPMRLHFFDVMLVTGSAFFITLLATLYPSRQAAKMEPVEGLRYE
ncbi:MAG: FtsX-like permease family protein [Nitrospirota bacterium]|nr:FtsX-like permease family protein [Nitrospirota bacterium]